MAKSHFPIPGRKKPTSLDAFDSQAMSKAHKILGSTPINIDAPAYASSSTVDITAAESARHPWSSDDVYLDEHARLALSEGEWDDDGIPRPPKQDLERGSGGRGHSRLKKSQSSSAIRTKKRLQAVARHCSSQMASGASPFRHARSKDEEANPSAFMPSHKTKKKPAMLDLSNLRPSSRLSRSSYQSQPDSAASLTFQNSHARSSGNMPSLPNTGILGGKRSSLKRWTKESFRSLLSDTSGSTSSSGPQREPHPDPGLSTLYSHYEQMSLLQVMKHQGHDSDELNGLQQMNYVDIQGEHEWEEAQTDQDLDWLHRPLRDPVQIMARTSFDEPPVRKSKAKKSPGRDAGRDHRAPKALRNNSNRNSQESDFHDKSILLLSDSDSDEFRPHADDVHASANDDAEEDPNAGMILLNRTYNANAQPAKARSGFARSEDSAQEPSRRRHGSDRSPRKGPHRRTDDGTSSPLRSHLAYDPRSPSPRASLSSSDSKASMMTCQFGFGGQETPVMTILPARRPSQAELEQKAARIRASRHSSSHRESITPKSPEQLTPPLSPSSVDFFLRSGRPSTGAPELPSRIMAVTREEKMLISALRKKNQAMREIARLGVHSALLSNGNRLQDLLSASSSKAAADQCQLESGLQALPNIHMQALQPVELPAASSRERPSMDLDSGVAKSPTVGHRPRELSHDGLDLPPPKERQGSSAMYQDVLVYLDQRKASLCIQGAADTIASISDLKHLPTMRSIFDQAALDPEHHHHHQQPADDLHGDGEFVDGTSLRGRFRPGRIQTENLNPNLRQPSPSRLATLCEQDLEELPPPESPISPECFPSIPENRVRSRNTARLSAVGLSIPAHLLDASWGDDDSQA